MVQRYSFGKMIPTHTVVETFPVQTEAPQFLQQNGNGWLYEMDKTDVIFGLGENVRGMNKRGFHYISNCTDEFNHGEDKESLYAAHNFFLMSPAPDSGRPMFGVFVDFAGKVFYDMGYTKLNLLTIETAEPDYDLYIITGDSANDICQQFRQMIGQCYIPPKWAFGFGQSRWGYGSDEEIRTVAKNYQENNIPLDMIYLDIDYMDGFANFTFEPTQFPDLPKLAADMKEQGIHLVPIIDAGIKVDETNPVCKEGVEKGYFCQKEDGSLFVGAVWPGKSYFADFLRPEVRDWFGSKYKMFLDVGIEGFWNDMNEPAIFYSPEQLNKAVAEIAAMQGQDDLNMDEFFGLKDKVNYLSNSDVDYASFYHDIDGERIRHDRVHNLYGYNMTRAAGEAFQKMRPDKRTLLFSRASCIGAHRYGGIWFGDNNSSWASLKMNVQQMPGVGMCGFLFSGADLGGFGCHTTPDLMLRWVQFGMFTPLMRDHTAHHTRNQELYRFEEEIPAFRNMVGLRYALLPYLYSEFMKAALGNTMYMRPLAFDYPEDSTARGVEDQLMLGEGLMVAPVTAQNAAGRYVYLPEPMKLMRLRSAADFDTEQLPAGHHYVACALEEVLIFLKPNAVVPVAQPASCVAKLDEETLTIWENLVADSATYRLYSDDGESTDYANPANWREIIATKG